MDDLLGPGQRGRQRFQRRVAPFLSLCYLAEAIQRAPTLAKDKLIIVNLSGRGDKDVSQVAAKVRLQMPE